MIRMCEAQWATLLCQGEKMTGPGLHDQIHAKLPQ